VIRGSCLCDGVRFEYARAVTQIGRSCGSPLPQQLSGAGTAASSQLTPLAGARLASSQEDRRVR
jgi:hypothetical protein